MNQLGEPAATCIDEETYIGCHQARWLPNAKPQNETVTDDPSQGQCWTKAGLHCSSRLSCPPFIAEMGTAECGLEGKEVRVIVVYFFFQIHQRVLSYSLSM